MKTLALFSFAFAIAIAPLAAVSADTPSFEVSVTGKGRPMILIPGLACPGAVWDSTVAHFSDRFECHVISLAGFGGVAPRLLEGSFLQRVRDELATYIRAHHLQQVVVVGHSLGGFVALDLAATHPDLVATLVVVDGVPFLTGLIRPGATAEEAKQTAVSMRQHFEGIDNDAYQQSIRSGASTRSMVATDEDHVRVVNWSLASDRATVTEAMTEMFGADLRKDLSRIPSPTLVLATWIAYKPFTDRARIDTAFRDQFAHLKGVKISITDTARHFIMFDDPQWLFSEIETFLAATPTATAR